MIQIVGQCPAVVGAAISADERLIEFRRPAESLVWVLVTCNSAAMA
jgi:hypothetical protein